MSHSTLSPSSSHEWLACSLSVKMRELYSHLDPNRYSEANAQGTIKHAVIERCLRKEYDPYRFVGDVFRLGDFREDDEDMPQEWADYEYEFTEDDADTIMLALDQIDTYEGEKFIEYRVDLSRFCGEGQKGTLDLAILMPIEDDFFDIDVLLWDNKFGRVGVNAYKNSQLMLYGIGIHDNIVKPRKLRVRNYIIRIWQPYVKGGGGEWTISAKNLMKFAEKVKPLAKAALGPNPTANPGPEQCEWCIGAKLSKCEANFDWNVKTLKKMLADDEDIDELVEKDEIPCLKFNGVDPKTRSWLINNFDMFKKFIERLETQAFEDAYYGNPVPGKKLARGNSPHRKYRNKVEAETVIVENLGSDKAYTKKVISPAQLEKIVGRAKMDEYSHLIERGEPKLILVDEHDSRPRVRSIREMFEDDD